MKPKIGEKAPAFCLLDAYENKKCLDEFKGKWVILYFYPKDNTPGCTLEAMDFSDLKQEFEKQGAVILGISKDSCKSHQEFIDKRGLTITLLSDPEAEVQKKYDVYALKKFMGREFMGTLRTTFIIDPQGKVQKIWDSVTVKGHAKDVLNELLSIKP